MVLCLTRQECVHTSQPTTSWRVENTHQVYSQTECVRRLRRLCCGLHSAVLCKCRGECFGSRSDGWLNAKGHRERSRRRVCGKESSVIRIFLSRLCEVFQGLGSRIDCCWKYSMRVSSKASAANGGCSTRQFFYFVAVLSITVLILVPVSFLLHIWEAITLILVIMHRSNCQCTLIIYLWTVSFTLIGREKFSLGPAFSASQTAHKRETEGVFIHNWCLLHFPPWCVLFVQMWT